MKPLLINPYSELAGGTEQRIRLLLQEFDRHPAFEEIHFLSFGESGHKQSGKVHFWQTRAGGVAKTVNNLIDKFGVDLVQQHNTQLIGVDGIKVAKQRKIPTVFVAHDFRICCPQYFLVDVWKAMDKENCEVIDLEKCERCVSVYETWLVKQIREVINQVDVGIAPTENMARIFEKNNVLVGKWRKVVPWVNTEFFHPDPNVRRREQQCMFAGNFIPHKGAWVLVKAWREVSKRLPYAKCIMQGDDRCVGQIIQMIKNYGLKGIELVRRMSPEDLRHLYTESSVCVFSSIWMETFGLIRAEANLCQTPVIASRIGGMLETSQYGHVLFEPRNYEQLAEELIDLFLDDERRERLGEEGRKWALETFQPKRACEDFIKIYQGVVK